MKSLLLSPCNRSPEPSAISQKHPVLFPISMLISFVDKQSSLLLSILESMISKGELALSKTTPLQYQAFQSVQKRVLVVTTLLATTTVYTL